MNDCVLVNGTNEWVLKGNEVKDDMSSFICSKEFIKIVNLQ